MSLGEQTDEKTCCHHIASPMSSFIKVDQTRNGTKVARGVVWGERMRDLNRDYVRMLSNNS